MFARMYDKSLKDSVAFGKQQRHMMKEHMRRQTALLSQQHEVKRLSDLLILEFRVGILGNYCLSSLLCEQVIVGSVCGELTLKEGI